jgi:hypothetical protein
LARWIAALFFIDRRERRLVPVSGWERISFELAT